MFYFDTGADDDDYGYMYCEWDENPALMNIRRHLERCIRGMWEGLEEIDSVQSVKGPSENEIQAQLDEMSVKALALLKEYALVMFRRTQGQIVADVTGKMIEEVTRETIIQPIREGKKLKPFSLAEAEGMQGVLKKFRKEMSELFQSQHKKTIGIRPGREAQVSVEKIIECLRKLPKGASQARLAAEMNVSTRAIQYSLKAAELKFAAAKQKAKQ